MLHGFVRVCFNSLGYAIFKVYNKTWHLLIITKLYYLIFLQKKSLTSKTLNKIHQLI